MKTIPLMQQRIDQLESRVDKLESLLANIGSVLSQSQAIHVTACAPPAERETPSAEPATEATPAPKEAPPAEAPKEATCAGTTKTGRACKRKATKGDYCHQHAPKEAPATPAPKEAPPKPAPKETPIPTEFTVHANGNIIGRYASKSAAMKAAKELAKLHGTEHTIYSEDGTRLKAVKPKSKPAKGSKPATKPAPKPPEQKWQGRMIGPKTETGRELCGAMHEANAEKIERLIIERNVSRIDMDTVCKLLHLPKDTIREIASKGLGIATVGRNSVKLSAKDSRTVGRNNRSKGPVRAGENFRTNGGKVAN